MTPARQRARVAELLGPSLLDSPWLRRLERISFLGTLDQHPRSRRASNRLEHSIGVAMLGLDAAQALELSEATTRVFVAACLLHDVGHYPLSHAAEPAFEKVLGASHHEVGRWIVLGDGAIARQLSLRPLLELLEIDPEAVWQVIDRGPALAPELSPLAELLRAPINLDTLEGIFRVARDFRLRAGTIPSNVFTWVSEIQIGIRRPALAAMDAFWRLKDRVYDRVINLPSNILAEARLCELVAEHVDASVFDRFEHFDDAALRRRLGERAFGAALLDGREDSVYEIWTRPDYGEQVGALTVDERGEVHGRTPLLSRVRKRYFVDRSVQPERGALALSEWNERWRHERMRAWLVSRREDQLSLPLPLGVALHEESPEI